MKKYSIPNLDIFISKTCNLSCSGCVTFSDSRLVKGITRYNQEHVTFWSKYLDPSAINMFGGEPLINPDLEKWIAGCREAWPYATINIQTNGILLQEKHYQIMQDYNVNMIISQHMPDYADTVTAFVDYFKAQGTYKLLEFDGVPTVNGYGKEMGWVNQQGNYVHVSETFNESVWWPFYQGTATESKPSFNYFSNDFESSWTTCVARTFVNMYDGNLYKCPAVVGLLINGPALGLDKDPDWESYFSQYKRLNINSDHATIKEWITDQAGPQSCCNMCSRSVSEDYEAQTVVNSKVKLS